MGKNREKYFRCPRCGDVLTKTEMLKRNNDGICPCNSILYDEMTKEEYEARLKEKCNKK